MGLDWMPGRKPRPGHEQELKQLEKALARRFCWGRQRKEARLEEVSISAEETLQAPVVGRDEAATAWAREQFEHRADRKLDLAGWLGKLDGLRVVELVPPCDGLARYTNGGAGQYIGVESFRAQFLVFCTEMLGAELIEAGYAEMNPQQCVEFGDALERKALAFAAAHGIDPARAAQAEDPQSKQFHVDVVLAAARWCRYWGRAGHGLLPWF